MNLMEWVNGLKLKKPLFWKNKSLATLKSQFTRVYKLRLWESGGTVSGVGSTLENTVGVRRIIHGVIEEYKINSVLDAPCGDFSWFSNLIENKPEINYYGVDIVQEIIEVNKLNHESKTQTFSYFNLAKRFSVLPRTDLIICRDLLVHLSLKDCKKVLRNFKKSGSKYLLITHFISDSNQLITNSELTMNFDGFGWRPLNMEDKIFGLGTAIEIWSENSKEEVPFNMSKTLALFRL
jgi:hypothetical protein